MTATDTKSSQPQQGPLPEEIEQRLREVRESAAKLVNRGKNIALPSRPPSQGWQSESDSQGSEENGEEEFESLNQFLQMLRGLVPNELNEQFIAALRELLIALRALIDWYLQRLEQTAEEEPRVVNIPIQ